MSQASVLSSDRSDLVYRWVFRPTLLLQLGLYLFAAGRLLVAPAYARLPGSADPLLHENHLGNIAIMESQPNPWLLATHMGMAVVWVAGVLLNKELAHRLVTAPRSKETRRAHRALGTVMCVVAFAGCLAGPAMAWSDHGHPAMQVFLLCLPLYFLPATAAVWVSARRRQWAAHRFWVTAGFVGPAVASLWAEALIYTFGRATPLGPYAGELWGVAVAFGLSAAVVLWPAWTQWRLGTGQSLPGPTVP